MNNEKIEKAKKYLNNYKYDNEVKEAIEIILNYIQQLEEREQKIKDKLKQEIEILKEESKYAMFHRESLLLIKQNESILNLYNEGENNDN